MTERQQLFLGAVAVAIIAIIVSVAIIALTIPTTGRITFIGGTIYSDSSLTYEVTTIEWGDLPAGTTAAVDVWCKITSNVPTMLTMTTDNWQPNETRNYMTLSWNYTDTVVYPDGVYHYRFTLDVSPDAADLRIYSPTGDFSFDILITITSEHEKSTDTEYRDDDY